MSRVLMVGVWLSCFIAIFATEYTGLFVILTALATFGLFFFPIQYANRDVVRETARQPLTWLSSPLPYCFIALLGLLVFFVAQVN
ncbi:hypothetical protein LJ739_08855 [Aestuariibacter halophilus]|uniref:Uncharacterized protein n=1 Tax=Fluctibacter halophilus TaxID=226011 RepID=A0ABS8G6X4_9ALTE|nr:hypothetical protein [Aestuariibacter halophilus]MCC2616347.1 hypothetical protein [Aestuariibacter halophilus]